MKLDMIEDMLGGIQRARNFKRLSTAVVCFQHLVVLWFLFLLGKLPQFIFLSFFL